MTDETKDDFNKALDEVRDRENKPPLAGYRELSVDEIYLMNEVTFAGERFGEVLMRIKAAELTEVSFCGVPTSNADPHALSQAANRANEALMWAHNAIIRPVRSL